MNTKISITEEVLINKIYNELHSCDDDALAHIAGILFGGECFAMDNHYDFYPNENYFDAFGKINDE